MSTAQQITLADSQLNQSDARELTDRIRSGLTDLAPLVHAAHVGRAWVALGYQTWEDYCAAEFVNSLPRLPREARPGQVAELREAGLSIRAIAAGLGVSTQTVQKDLRPDDVVNHHNDDEPEADTWPPDDVDIERRDRWLSVAMNYNLAPDLPTTEEDEAWIESAFIQDSADIPLSMVLLLGLPVDDLMDARIGSGILGRMALYRSVGISRKRVRQKFTPWFDMVLSPSVRTKRANDTAVQDLLHRVLDGDEQHREELIEVLLDNLASIPHPRGGVRDE